MSLQEEYRAEPSETNVPEQGPEQTRAKPEVEELASTNPAESGLSSADKEATTPRQSLDITAPQAESAPTSSQAPATRSNRRRLIGWLTAGAVIAGSATTVAVVGFTGKGSGKPSATAKTNHPGAEPLPSVTPKAIPHAASTSLSSIPRPSHEVTNKNQLPEQISRDFLQSFISDKPDVGYSLTGGDFRQTFSLHSWESYVNIVNEGNKFGRFQLTGESTDNITQGTYSLVANTRSAHNLPPLPDNPYEGRTFKTLTYSFTGKSKEIWNVLLVQQVQGWQVADLSIIPA